MRPVAEIILGTFCALGLAACSAHPIIDDVTRVSTYDVVEQIRCEAGRALKDLAPGFTHGAIAYEFDFEITERNNANAAATLTFPFVSGGQFTLDLADPTQANRTRAAKRNFRIVDSFTDAKSAECFGPAPRKNLAYPISGEIGVYELVKTFIQLAQASTFEATDPHGKLPAPTHGLIFVFADTLNFTTTLGFVGAHAVLKLNPIRGRARVTSANLNFTAQREDKHNVTIAIAAEKLKPGQHLLMRTLPIVAGVPGAGFTSNTLLATTLIQGQSTPEQKALFELDRQRILALQRNVPNLLVGP